MLLGEGVQWPWARLSGSLLEGHRALGCISEGPGSWTVLLPNRQIASPPFLQVNQNNSLKSVLYMSSAFAEIQTSAALKTKMQNHCSLWKKWLHNGDRGQFSDKGGCSPKSDHVDSSLLCSTWCQVDLGAARNRPRICFREGLLVLAAHDREFLLASTSTRALQSPSEPY